MAEAVLEQLRNNFTKLSSKTLQNCADAFGHGTKDPLTKQFLVQINCGEVIAQGIDELFSSLLEEMPVAREHLLGECNKTQEQLAEDMKADLLAGTEKCPDSGRQIIAKALDIPDASPKAICEQILINGLDAYLSHLVRVDKLEPLATEFGVPAGVEDAVEQIIDQIFPPSAEIAAIPTAPAPAGPLRKPGPSAQGSPVLPSNPTPGQPPLPKSTTMKPALTQMDNNEIIRATRSPLQKGITMDELQNYYWEKELRTFCKENNLKAPPKKALMIRIVHDFLNTGKVVPAGAPKGKRKGGAAGRNSKKAKTAEAEGQADGDGDADAAEDGDDNAQGEDDGTRAEDSGAHNSIMATGELDGEHPPMQDVTQAPDPPISANATAAMSDPLA